MKQFAGQLAQREKIGLFGRKLENMLWVKVSDNG
jgi:hypothetical protein